MTEKNVKIIKSDLENKKSEDISEHMTRAEMIAELMVLLNDVRDEDMPTVHQLIREAMRREPSDQ